MNKILVGVILGAVLGAFDGMTAWFTPEVRKDILSIVFFSSIKGVMAGVAAGIFARKVHSTVAGVVFGLFVGLGLAYWVAAMQDKHYFEIMLPGSIVGAILGWATQRYGRPSGARGSVATAMLLAMTLIGVNVQAEDAKPNAAFEKIKALAGKHEPTLMTADGQKTKVEYRVTANGTTVIETMFAGDPHEMVTVYTADGDSVVARHYCSGGNQPVMKLNAAKSTENKLVFEFVNVTGDTRQGHINGVTFKFDGGNVEESWSSAGSEDHMRLYYKK